jgi:hypothetical protein
MEELLEKVYSIVVLKRDYLRIKTHGSFFSSRDLKKSCDIDINQISSKENLNSFLIELADNLIKKKKEFSNLIIENIELDTIADKRIQNIIDDMNKFNFKLKHILETKKQDFPKLETNIDETLPKDIYTQIKKLIDNYNYNYNKSNNLFELFKLHSYLKSVQKLRIQPEDIINDNLILNGKKIKLDDYVISQFTINIIFENKPVSNIVYYKTYESKFYFKFSKLYSSIPNTIYYYKLLKELKYYVIVGYFKKIFPKNIAYLIPNLRDRILEFKESLSVYSYKMCKYETLIEIDEKNKDIYKKKYLKYYNKINRKSQEFIDTLILNPKLYEYLLENIEIRF